MAFHAFYFQNYKKQNVVESLTSQYLKTKIQNGPKCIEVFKRVHDPEK